VLLFGIPVLERRLSATSTCIVASRRAINSKLY